MSLKKLFGSVLGRRRKIANKEVLKRACKAYMTATAELIKLRHDYVTQGDYETVALILKITSFDEFRDLLRVEDWSVSNEDYKRGRKFLIGLRDELEEHPERQS
jgi:hypothetical protein